MMEIRNEQGERLLTPNEASERLGLTPHQVRWLIRNHRIEGVVKRGRDFFIPETSLKNVLYHKTGRPRKVWLAPGQYSEHAAGGARMYAPADTIQSETKKETKDEEGNEDE